MRWRTFFWLVLALIPLKLLAFAYKFGEGDHNEQLPMILRALDPNYLRADWVVNSNQGFNHRWFWTHFMALLGGRELSFYLVYIACTALWATGLWALVHEVWRSHTRLREVEVNPVGAGVSGVLAVALLFFTPWGSISNAYFDWALVPGTLAWPLMVWFAVNLRRGNWILAGAILLAAGLAQALIGPTSGCFLLMAQWYALSGRSDDPEENQTTENTRRAFLRHWPLWLVGIAFPLGLALLSTGGTPLTPAQSREAIDILVYVRHPWHYAPFTWPPGLWFAEVSWLMLVWVARRATRPSRFLDALLVIVTLFCLSGFFPFLIDRLYPLVKLQPFRMTVWLQIAGACYVAPFVAGLLTSRERVRVVAGAVLTLALITQTPMMSLYFRPLLPLCLAGFLFWERRTRSGHGGWSRWLHLLWLVPWLPFWIPLLHFHDGRKIWTRGAVLAALILGVVWLCQSKRGIPKLGLRGAQALTALGALLLLVAWAPKVPSPLRRAVSQVKPHLEYVGDEGALERWVQANTPPDAVFVTPPALDSFRLKGNRAVVANFKVFPWSDSGLLDWRKRIVDLCGGKVLPLGEEYQEQLDTAYAALTPEQAEQLARKYKASYFLATSASRGNFSRWPLVYSNPQFRLYRVN